jgi:hypothetical protein
MRRFYSTTTAPGQREIQGLRAGLLGLFVPHNDFFAGPPVQNEKLAWLDCGVVADARLHFVIGRNRFQPSDTILFHAKDVKRVGRHV